MKWKNVPKDINEYQGFIYVITHKATGKYYIGKKFYWSKKTRPPLKGRKNKRHYRVESDWKNYWGSSNNLLIDIKKFGKKNFKREIMINCYTKFECAYEEMKMQVLNNALFDENCYNEVISVRLRRRKGNNNETQT